MKDDIAIHVEKVHKDFLLPHEKAATLKSVFTGLLKGKRRRTIQTQHALKDISFEIKKGEFFGIVGRNGSGKSTLLKILAGIYQPTKGAVHVSGKLVPFIELGVGFNPELTGRENVFLNGALLGFSREEIQGMYESIVDFAELRDFMDQKLKNYSSGMQVRLAFSMAVRAKADVLLVDEVLAVGDADFQRKCYQYFRLLKKNKKTVVFVSHDMDAVRDYCDRAILIENHKVVFSGLADEVAEEYTKMFNTQSQEQSTDNNIDVGTKQDRWGDGLVKYTTLQLKSITKDTVVIKAQLQANSEITRPILGILIKNSEGQSLYGTNSKILRIRIDKLKRGEKRSLTWKLPNILSTGTYTVDVAISHRDGITQHDWWHDALEFNIVNERSTPHVISPPIELELAPAR